MRSLYIPLVASLLSLGLSLASANPQLSPYTLHEKRHRLPSGWARSHKHHAAAVIPLRFGLSQSNLDNIDEFLNEVSHPESPNYGQHWTPARIAETFAPSQATVDVVLSWLLDNGFEGHRVKVTPSRGWVELNATVEEAERLLLAEYHVYQHESGSNHIGIFFCFPFFLILFC